MQLFRINKSLLIYIFEKICNTYFAETEKMRYFKRRNETKVY